MSKLSKTPRFKRMYRKGYLFEKKTRAVITSILSQYNNLLHYSIESRGSKGMADLMCGVYNTLTKGMAYVEIYLCECSNIYYTLRKI